MNCILIPFALLCLGLFLPAFVRPVLDSFESAKQVPQPDLKDVSWPLVFFITLRVFLITQHFLLILFSKHLIFFDFCHVRWSLA